MHKRVYCSLNVVTVHFEGERKTMMKTKFILPVFAMVLVLGLSNAAFAQLSCNVASTPVSRATDTGLTEPAGDLILNCTGGGTPTTTATMTIDYGVAITNTTAYPAGKPIAIVSNTGLFAGAGLNPTIASVTPGGSQIIISIPGSAATASASPNASFTLTGTLLAISGSGKTSVNASLSVSPGNGVLITAGQTSAVVITTVLPGLTAPKITAFTSPGVILGSGVPVAVGGIAGGFSISVSENYIDMLRNVAQFNGGFNTQGVQLTYTFAGIPAGVTFAGVGTAATLCTLSDSAGGVAQQPPGFVSANGVISATTPTLTIEIGVGGTATNPSLTAIDTVTVACPNVYLGATATLPLTPGSITATVTLAPTGVAFGAGNTPLVTVITGGQVPRYTANQLPSPPLVVANIIPSATDMLFPFVSIGNGFDTGFSVSNTTGDPFGGAKNGGATPAGGTVTLYFFPNTGASFCVTTGGTATNPTIGGTGAVNCTTLASTTVGTGLSAGGVVAAGSSWIVLGSQVLAGITGAPPVFNGYVFGVANFTNAHPLEFVADAAFSGKFASGGPALVLPAPAIAARVGAGVGVEGLNH